MSKDFFKTRDNLNRLELDDPPVHLRVNSRKLWNYSNLLLKVGEVYQIKTLEDQRWTDFFIKADADGYESTRRYMRKAEAFRRHRSSNWMALIGCINHKYDFLIGKTKTYKAISEGELILYANGSIDWYWTHWGSIDISISRIE